MCGWRQPDDRSERSDLQDRHRQLQVDQAGLGSDSGIVQATAVAFAGEGADVVIAYLHDADGAASTSQQVEAAGRKATPGSQVYLTGEVRNSGDETAEAVQVVAELIVIGEVVATGEQAVDFLSGGETEEVVFIFDQVPSEAEPRARVASYSSP